MILQVTVADKKAEGKGSTKKEAKKEAAEAMLIQMGYKPSNPDTPVPIPGADATPGKPTLKQPQDNRETKKVSLTWFDLAMIGSHLLVVLCLLVR